MKVTARSFSAKLVKARRVGRGPGGGGGSPSFASYTADGAVASGAAVVSPQMGTAAEVAVTTSTPSVLASRQVISTHPLVLASCYEPINDYYFVCWKKPGEDNRVDMIVYRLNEAKDAIEASGGPGKFSYSAGVGTDIVSLDVKYSTVADRFYIAMAFTNSGNSNETIRAIQFKLNSFDTESATINTITMDTAARSKADSKVVVNDEQSYVTILWSDAGIDEIRGRSFGINSGGYSGSIGSASQYINNSGQNPTLWAAKHISGSVFAFVYQQAAAPAYTRLVAVSQSTQSALPSVGSPITISNDSLPSGYVIDNGPNGAISFAYRNSTSSFAVRTYTLSGTTWSGERTRIEFIEPRYLTVYGFFAETWGGSNKFIVTYGNRDDGEDLYATIYDFNDSNYQLDNPVSVELDASNTQYMTAAYAAANRVLWVAYEDVVDMDVLAYAFDGLQTSNNTGFIGIAQSAANDGEEVLVALSGQVAAGLSGLTPAATYYVDTDGTLTTDDTGVVAGVAQSDTELLVA
jgi:hypothetical protein